MPDPLVGTQPPRWTYLEPQDAGPQPPAAGPPPWPPPGWQGPPLLPKAALPPVAPSPAESDRDRRVQAALDGVLREANAPYTVSDGGSTQLVSPGVGFKMARTWPQQAASMQAMRAAIQAAATKAALTDSIERITAGRGSIGSVHALTQALLGAGQLPAPETGTLAERVRRMMFDCGLGVDCAGYVQQAYLRVAGRTRESAGLQSPENEDLSNLGSRGFTRMDDVTRARPGDIFVLGPPLDGSSKFGHRAIVYESHVASTGELQQRAASFATDESGSPAARTMLLSGHTIQVFQVDSSWGNGGSSQVGGVRRETWFYDRDGGQWGFTFTTLCAGGPCTAFAASGQPYAHSATPPNGLYRGRVP